MTPADLRALADQRLEDAIREGLEQLKAGWKAEEVVAVLADALGPIAELRDQADEVEAAEAYWNMLDRARQRTARLRRLTSLRGVL